MTVEEYKESVNWDVCTEAQSSSCNVPCAPNDTVSRCPDLSDLGWQTDNKCYVKKDAEDFIKNIKNYDVRKYAPTNPNNCRRNCKSKIWRERNAFRLRI